MEGKEARADVTQRLETLQSKLDEMNNRLSTVNDPAIRATIKSKITEMTSEINKMRAAHDRYCNQIESGTINSSSEGTFSIFEKYKTEFKAAFDKAEKAANKIEEVCSETKTKFLEDSNLFNLINKFKEYLDSLSFMEICLVINITTSLFILGCIISIFFALSGNFLLEKFYRSTLKQRFPRLIKIIQIRVKFQRYYVYVNSILIILAVLSLIIVNTVTLINA